MPVALMIMLLLTGLGLGALSISSLDLLTMRSQKKGKQAFYAAEGGIVYGTKELETLLATALDPPLSASGEVVGVLEPDMTGFNFETFSICQQSAPAPCTGPTPPTVVTITTGPYAGLNSISTPYTITVQASGVESESGTIRLTQTLQDQLIPLFQFGVFYDGDLEIFPGPNMTFNGRIHSNKNIYIGSSNTLTVDSRMSSAGDIYTCRKDSSTAKCFSVQIKKPDETYATLDSSNDHCLTWDPSVGCTDKDPDWATNAYNTWEGLVQDSSHGVKKLTLPVGTDDPIDLIKRGDTIDPATSTESTGLKNSRVYWQADLRILDGVAYDKIGNVVTLDPGVLTTKTMWDYREGKMIVVREVNIGLLNDCACKPANGILYISETQNPALNDKGVRLANGATVPPGGLTVGSDNPIYVKGNYNTEAKKGAAIISDAVKFLSSNWKDCAPPCTGTAAGEYREGTAVAGRQGVSGTSVNAAVMTGNTSTVQGGGGSNYNGGLENLPRFLEDWSGGKKFNLSGSLIDLWQSQQHKAPWGGTSNIYKPPKRNWKYDTSFDNLANLPPGTPRVRTLALAQWARQ